jgi:hypothetical protein
MEFYLATKTNEILSFAGNWMEVENIILSEVRLPRPKAHALPHRWNIDLKQMQQYYGIWVTLRGGHIQGR